MKSELTLIGFDIEGQWNAPLLKNAAEMSNASLLFSESSIILAENSGEAGKATTEIDELLTQFDQVLACESTQRSRSVYELAAPRGRIGVIVGNERHGISNRVLKKADHVVSIPMLGRGISSVNVAVAAAIILYALERDFGRQRFRKSALCHNEIDVLICGPQDPSELGSLLRSAWAFGWRRVFLADPSGVWFTKDRQTILAGRAAARCEVNRIVVSPDEQLNFQDYDHIVVCGKERHGTPLSRFSPPNRGRVLLVYGRGDIPSDVRGTVEPLFVDYAEPIEACFRHAGSIVLSVVSQCLRRGRRG